MVTPAKIDEWLKEVEQRPESAALILRHIANRLRDLASRNEELLAENIALQNGARVEEFEQQIAHLEYQLSILKRRFGEGALVAPIDLQPDRISLLAYDLKGRIIKLETDFGTVNDEILTGHFSGEIQTFGELPRLLAVPSREELLFLYTSGRVGTHPVSGLSSVAADKEWDFGQAPIPDEFHPGERLVSLMPVGELPLVDYFIQVSRRGCVKKTMTSIAGSVFSNRFIGRGTVQKADQPFEIMLARKSDRMVLISAEGQALSLEVDDLTYSVEERLHLSGTDHVVAAFILPSGASILILTQSGKVIHRSGEVLEPSHTMAAKGTSLIPPSRRDQGVRAIGASPVFDKDRLVVLQGDGKLSLQVVSDLSAAGSISAEAGLLSFTRLPSSVPEG